MKSVLPILSNKVIGDINRYQTEKEGKKYQFDLKTRGQKRKALQVQSFFSSNYLQYTMIILYRTTIS